MRGLADSPDHLDYTKKTTNKGTDRQESVLVTDTAAEAVHHFDHIKDKAFIFITIDLIGFDIFAVVIDIRDLLLCHMQKLHLIKLY